MHKCFTVPATRYTERFVVAIGQLWHDGSFGFSLLAFGPRTSLLSLSHNIEHCSLLRTEVKTASY